MPPIFEPEAIAREIYRATQETPRELWIGASAVTAIASAFAAPLLGDRLLASKGYDSQMTSEPESPDRRDNLFEPLPGDPGTHGRFDDRSRMSVLAFDPFWLRTGLACGLFASVVGAYLMGDSRRRSFARKREVAPSR